MSRKLTLGIITSLVLLISFGIIFSFVNQANSEGAVNQQYTITVPAPAARDAGGKLYYEIKDYGVNAVLGLPLLPHKKLYFEIPFNAKDVNVTLLNTTSRPLGVITNLGVFQGFAPSDTAIPVRPDLAAARLKYTLNNFPAENFKVLGENSIKGHRLVAVAINPLVQNLATSEVIFYDSYTIKVDYNLDAAKAGLDAKMAAKRSPAFEDTAKKLIYNYQELQPVKTLSTADILEIIPLQLIVNVPIKYAIITLPENASAMQPLADWKTKTGTPAKVYTTDWIDANYTGADLQEKIRKFLTEISPNAPYNPYYSAKFDWLLIAGEQGAGMPETMAPAEGVKLPARYVGAPGFYWYTDDQQVVPADYYYADCADSGAADSFLYDWDTNDSGIFGELSDDIRWIPDTYVGRIPSNISSELTNVVNKLIAYEKTPAVGTWAKEAVLAGAKSDDFTDGATVMQFIKNDFLDPASITNYRLYYLNNYPKEADLSETNFISYVSQGGTYVNWAAHGSNMRAVLYQSGPYFIKGDVTTITNGDKRSVVYAESCDNGKFDYYYYTPSQNVNYSIGDSVLIGYNKPDWGVAFIGSARTSYYWLGWNSPTQSGDDGDNYRFNQQLFGNGKYHLGQALYDAKLQIVNDFDGNPTFDPDTSITLRKNLFVVNLLGDPEMELWTAEPQQMNITIGSYVWKNNNYSVWVKDASGQPIEGVLVTSYKPNDAFATGITDVNGEVIFQASTQGLGLIQVTATKHNYIPAEASIDVQSYPYRPKKWSCPYIYNWNGTEFVKDNDILPAGNPMYYHDYYKLMKPLVAKDGKYLINIVDSEDETSWIDMVKLIQVDHPKDVSIAPTPEGNILTYKIPVPALSAVDKHKKDQLAKVAYMESTEEQSFYGKKGEIMELNFGPLKTKDNGARLIMRTDLKCPWYENPIRDQVSVNSLHVFVLANNKSWVKVGVVHPHQGWDEWAVAIPDKVLKQVKGDVKVKIEWTKDHRLDYVGLDTSRQEAVVVAELPLLKALHSKDGDVLKTITAADKKPAVTVMDQQIDLEFATLSDPNQARSFVFESAGKYKANK